MKYFIAMLLLVIASGSVQAKEIYIDGVNGTNGASCGPIYAPCQTPHGTNAAFQKASAGDYIYFLPGEYPCWYADISGTPGNMIHIYGAPGVHISSDNSSCGGNGIFINSNQHDLDIEFFEVNFAYSGASIAATGSGNYDLKIANNTLHRAASGGIIIDRAECINYYNNHIYKVGGTGDTSGASIYEIETQASCAAGWDGTTDGQKNHIWYNDIKLVDEANVSTTDGNCIIIDDLLHTQHAGSAYTGSILVAYNSVSGCHGRGIHAFLSNNVTIDHNMVANNCANTVVCGTSGSPANTGEISCDGTSSHPISNCIVTNNFVIGSANEYAGEANWQTGTANTWSGNTWCSGLGATRFTNGTNNTSSNTAACPSFINPVPSLSTDLRLVQ